MTGLPLDGEALDAFRWPFRDKPIGPPLVIEVLSRPVTQGSKVAFLNRHSGQVVMKEQLGTSLQHWREDVRAAAVPYEGRFLPKQPLLVIAYFTLAKPKTAPKRRRLWPTSKRNDLEKLMRSTADALTSSKLYDDDSQVIQQILSKSFPGEGDGMSSPGVRLLIYPLD